MADPSTSPPLTRASVIEARELIKAFVHHTPTLTNATLDRIASSPSTFGEEQEQEQEQEGNENENENESGKKRKANPTLRLYFKCENLQRIGAFKVRGAFHAIERLKREPGWAENGGPERGVVTHSSGNHAQALALAARENGIPAHIVMPRISAPPKIAGTKGYGANVTFSGSTSVEREAVVETVMKETGARLVPPYDHPDIVLGQGTLGLELLEDARGIMENAIYISDGEGEGEGGSGEGGSTTKERGDERMPVECSIRAPATIREIPAGKKANPRLDAILAPCGGGGMLSGVALACEGTGTRVYGCEPSFQGADDGKRGYEAGRRVEAVSSLTIADGLRTPVGKVPWSVIYERKLVSGFFSVSDAQIVAALRLVYERLKMVVEPSAVVPLAVALFCEEFRELVEREGGSEGWDVGVVFSGGNVSLEALGGLFAEN